MLFSQLQIETAPPVPFAPQQKRASGKFFYKSRASVKSFYPQLCDASGKIAFANDNPASGATVGRYISSDPIGIEGGLNTFGYVTANPVSLSDTEGLILPLVAVVAGEIVVEQAAALALRAAAIQAAKAIATAQARRIAAAEVGGMISGGATRAVTTNAAGVSRPTVTDPKLNNLVCDLYKGQNTPKPLGTGSTADAIRNELATGQATYGTSHLQKGREYVNALRKWLANNPNATTQDRAAAQKLLDDLLGALEGK